MPLFFKVERIKEEASPQLAPEPIVTNVVLLAATGAILLIAYLFPIKKYPLGYCVFSHLTGYPCPTCGFTRAFCAFANGNYLQGLGDCPFAFLLFATTLFVFIYNAIAVIAALSGFRLVRGSFFQFPSRKIAIIAIISFLLLAANWIYRLSSGLK